MPSQALVLRLMDTERPASIMGALAKLTPKWTFSIARAWAATIRLRTRRSSNMSLNVTRPYTNTGA